MVRIKFMASELNTAKTLQKIDMNNLIMYAEHV